MKKNCVLFYLFVSTNILLCAQQVTLVIKTSHRGDKVKTVDENIQELSFVKTRDGTTGVYGLEKLKNLRSITFDKMDITDYSFLKEAKTLEKLVLIWPHATDWTFIEALSNLKILFIYAYSDTSIALDLTNLKSLEYLAISASDLESFPAIKNIPKSLKYLNLTSNKITALPPDFGEYNHTTIFLKANPIEKQGIKKRNIIFDWARIFLPKSEEYDIPY
jgi:hypothetical protein